MPLRAPIKIFGTPRKIAPRLQRHRRLAQLRSRGRRKTASKILAPAIPRALISNRAQQPQADAPRNRHSQNLSARNHTARSRSTQNPTAKNRAALGNRAHRSEGKAPEARSHTVAASHSESSAPTRSSVQIKIPTTIAPSSQNPKPPGVAQNRSNPAAAVAPTPAADPTQNSASSQRAAAVNPEPPGNRANPPNPAHSAAPKATSRNRADAQQE